jgi:hypothetical protein
MVAHLITLPRYALTCTCRGVQLHDASGRYYQVHSNLVCAQHPFRCYSGEPARRVRVVRGEVWAL